MPETDTVTAVPPIPRSLSVSVPSFSLLALIILRSIVVELELAVVDVSEEQALSPKTAIAGSNKGLNEDIGEPFFKKLNLKLIYLIIINITTHGVRKSPQKKANNLR